MATVVERDIAYKQYARVVSIGMNPELAKTLDTYTTEQIRTLEAWTKLCDRQAPNERFYILETDGYRMPDSVQNLYGKRYLVGLNAIKQAIVKVLADRALAEVLVPSA